jgi:hypothetical protein
MAAPSKNEVLHNGGTRRKNEYKSTKMSVRRGVVPSGMAHWERQFIVPCSR